jgi:drug/metabolite transporter (DMT)-like permease
MRYSTGLALVFIAGVLWSSMGLVLRQIDGAGVWTILFWRSAGTVAVLALYLAMTTGLWRSLRLAGLPGVLGGLCLVPAFAGAVYAYQTTTIANAVFLFATAPFLAALLGWLALRERVRPVTFAAMALGAAGIFLMVREGLSMGALPGNVAALLSAAGFAGFTVCLRWGRVADMAPAILLGSLFCMAAGAVGSGITGLPLPMTAANTAWAVSLGAVVVGGGLYLYTRGAQVLTAAELTLLSMVEVMLAPVWAFLLLDERMTPAMLAGGGVLLAAVLWNGLSGARRQGVASRASL